MADTKRNGAWAERYRERWKWDDVHFGSHSVDCYPGGCSFRIFTHVHLPSKMVIYRFINDIYSYLIHTKN